jgi:hypothetical protein
MPNDLPDGDPKQLWQNQPTERPSMTLKLIQSRARELHAKTRRKLLGTLASPLLVFLFCAYQLRTFPPLQRVLGPLCALAFVWSMIGLYFLNRGMRSSEMSGDAGLSTGLAFCRRELERQSDLVNRNLLWSFGPVMMAIGTFILALVMVTRNQGLFPNGLPFLILVVLWIVGYFMFRLREQRQLKYEIDELNELESDSTR